jgi:DNA-binding MarR family transcriptional regulator
MYQISDTIHEKGPATTALRKLPCDRLFAADSVPTTTSPTTTSTPDPPVPDPAPLPMAAEVAASDPPLPGHPAAPGRPAPPAVPAVPGEPAPPGELAARREPAPPGELAARREPAPPGEPAARREPAPPGELAARREPAPPGEPLPGHESAPPAGFWLHQAALTWRAQLDVRLRPLGLTPTQFLLLSSADRLERRAGPATQQEVAQQAGADRMMTSKVLRLLEKRGLLSRTAHESDARSVRVALSMDGRALAERAAAIAREFDDAFFGAGAELLCKELQAVTEIRGR